MIRLQRRGKIRQATFRLVVGEKKSKLKGEQLEELGWFDSNQNKSSFNKERILHWMSKGAKLSPTVNNLLIGSKIIEGKKIAVHKQPKKGEEAKAAEAPKEAAPAAEAPKAE
ncbi:MAG: 30S ribosomal protein S16 [Candidatus Pacebacteria bacterium]|nr:30S ribosomal protein S16 [Candidatus Paceibacterota bacterium]